MKNESVDTTTSDKALPPICGLVMPISAMDGYPLSHWNEMRDFYEEAANECGLKLKLVSQSDEVTVIHKSIIENLYNNPIVICDISGKNPNVMFEFGIRITFDKPIIITKDSDTSFSFDSSPLEHLIYPKGMRYHVMIEKKKELIHKIKSTLEASKNPNYSPFIQHFGNYSVKNISEKSINIEKLIQIYENRFDKIESIIKQTYSDLRSQSSKNMDPIMFSTKDGKFRVNTALLINTFLEYADKENKSYTSVRDYLNDYPLVVSFFKSNKNTMKAYGIDSPEEFIYIIQKSI